MLRKTKIVCTIGPASSSPERLRNLAAEGMDVARVNFSHGTATANLDIIRSVKQVRREAGKNIGILQDLAGPKIRVGDLPEAGARMQEGERVRLSPGGGFQEEAIPLIPILYPRLLDDVPAGTRILLDDGLLELRVERLTAEFLECSVVHGGWLKSHKGVNFPELILSERAPTPKDLQDLALGLQEGIDFVALSFVQTAEDLHSLRREIDRAGAQVSLVAKLERAMALRHLDSILDASDGVMVARGDLGIEADLSMIPVYQKLILRKANLRGLVAITATQMLDSMIRNPLPTRAEVTDVANAIYDGSDAIMLAGETAAGAYPVEALKMMRRIADRVEENLGLDRGWLGAEQDGLNYSTEQALARSVCQTAERLKARLILAQTISGKTARLIAKYRPLTPIVAVTPLESTCHQLSMVWGVHALLLSRFEENFLDTTAAAEQMVLQKGYAQAGDLLVVSAGIPASAAGGTNVMKLQVIGRA